jgi:hypothetical protein
MQPSPSGPGGRQIKAALALVGCCIAALSAPAPAMAGTLDQEQASSTGHFEFGGEDGYEGQTFTAGISGLLDQVDLRIATSSPTCGVTIEIRNVTGGLPTNVLAIQVIPPGSLPTSTTPPIPFTSVIFSNPATVVAGTQYAIALSANETACGQGGKECSNPYAGGTNVYTVGGGPWTTDTQCDLAFRTYVATPPPPPPPPPPAPTGACQGQTVAKTDGTEGDDTLIGTPAAEAIFGLAGNDDIDGVDGNDCLDGGDGDDILRGGADNDLELGGEGDDKVRGQGGKDKLKGGDGKDRLNGGEGKDRLAGGPGKDKLRGAEAKDAYKGNAGADDINAVDAKTDRVNCGGGDDKAVVDPVDRVSRNCETVREVDRG